MIAWLIVGVFVFWAALSLLVHVPRCHQAIRGADLLSLVPEWKFFGPKPGQYDYFLLFRDLLPDGTVTPWKEVIVAPPRRWWNWAWNPGRRGNKALFDLVTEFAAHIMEKDPAIEISIPYLSLLTTVSAQPRLQATAQTQFMVMIAFGADPDRPSELLYVSKPHDVD